MPHQTDNEDKCHPQNSHWTCLLNAESAHEIDPSRSGNNLAGINFEPHFIVLWHKSSVMSLALLEPLPHANKPI